MLDHMQDRSLVGKSVVLKHTFCILFCQWKTMPQEAINHQPHIRCSFNTQSEHYRVSKKTRPLIYNLASNLKKNDPAIYTYGNSCKPNALYKYLLF